MQITTVIKRILSLLPILLAALLISCSSGSVYEKVVKNPEDGWHIDSLHTFTFTIPEDGNYDLYYVVKNRTNYPYSNLYFKYDLRNEKSQVGSGLQEVTLFHPVTGKPYGRGFGGVMEHKFVALQNEPLEKGEHTLFLQHYMREPVLNGVLAVGVRVDKSSE